MNLSQHWRLKSSRYQLQGNYHQNGERTFPPRPEIKQRDVDNYEFDIEAEPKEEMQVRSVA